MSSDWSLGNPLDEAPAKRNLRWVWWLVAVVIVGAAAAKAWDWRQQQRDPLAAFELATVRRGELEDAVTAMGRASQALIRHRAAVPALHSPMKKSFLVEAAPRARCFARA